MSAAEGFTHLSSSGVPRMVDVSGKLAATRTATARARITLPPVLRDLLDNGEITSPKGPVFQTAVVAGVMAAKRTPDLIPMCHPVGLEDCTITISDDAGELTIECHAVVTHKTGVEMEALTGATVAALTVYDMCKGITRDIIITDVRLMEKSGGKSGEYRAASR